MKGFDHWFESNIFVENHRDTDSDKKRQINMCMYVPVRVYI